MASQDSTTCAFPIDRDLYNQYKSIVVRKGKTVKGDLIDYMRSVIENQASNSTENKTQS